MSRAVTGYCVSANAVNATSATSASEISCPGVGADHGPGVPHRRVLLVGGDIWGELAATTTVFGYNRSGVDGSAAPQHPQTGTAVVDTLRKTLARVFEIPAVPREALEAR